MTKSAIYCEHANEMPQTCPCPADCYCKEHSCKPRRFDTRICPTCGGLKKVQASDNIPKSTLDNLAYTVFQALPAKCLPRLI